MRKDGSLRYRYKGKVQGTRHKAQGRTPRTKNQDPRSKIQGRRSKEEERSTNKNKKRRKRLKKIFQSESRFSLPHSGKRSVDTNPFFNQ